MSIMQMENLINFKVLVLGSQGVGKSSLLIRYLKDMFQESYNVTVGVQFASKMVMVAPDMRVRLQIWDTAGQEFFRALVKSFYQGISAVFLVYSIDNKKSLRELKSWVTEVRQNSHPEVVFFLIGAKADRQDNREVPVQVASRLLQEIQGALLVETSAKTGQNVQTLFKMAADYMYKKYTINGQFQDLVKPERQSKITQSPVKRKRGSILLKKESVFEQTNATKKEKCCQ